MQRRTFLAASAAAAAAPTGTAKPALLGGSPVRTQPYSPWPIVDQLEERRLLTALRSKRWNRTGGGASQVAEFEKSYAEALGVPACLATANGTASLLATLQALDIGPGDEVIVPPYTFVATVNVVLQQFALPVFVDTDPRTFQIDAKKVEAAITRRTAAIMPVHLGGNVADLDALLAIGKKHGIPVIEDACQAHLAEWRGRSVGTYGAAGCFSFQASKNLNAGEGGAIVSNDTALIERAYTFHNNSRGRATGGTTDFRYRERGLNLRLTEFQGAILLAQMTRLQEQSRRREENAKHLTGLLNAIGGVVPAAQYDGCTRNAYHLYMFRYQASEFAGLSRSRFLEALRAEGIPASGGYTPLNEETLSGNYAAIQGIPAHLRRQCVRGLAAAQRLPGQPTVVSRGCLADANHVAGP